MTKYISSLQLAVGYRLKVAIQGTIYPGWSISILSFVYLSIWTTGEGYKINCKISLPSITIFYSLITFIHFAHDFLEKKTVCLGNDDY